MIDRFLCRGRRLRPSLLAFMGLLWVSGVCADPCDTLRMIVPGPIDSAFLQLVRLDTLGTTVIPGHWLILGDSSRVEFDSMPDSGEFLAMASIWTFSSNTPQTMSESLDYAPPRITIAPGYLLPFPPDTLSLLVHDLFLPRPDSVLWQIGADPTFRTGHFDTLSGQVRFSLRGAGILPERPDSIHICVTATDRWAEVHPERADCGLHRSRTCLDFMRAPETNCRVHPIPFTPNGDGMNDTLWFADSVAQEGHYRILDMNARLVREGPVRQGWDGKDGQGRPMPAGPYLYEVTISGATCKGVAAIVR